MHDSAIGFERCIQIHVTTRGGSYGFGQNIVHGILDYLLSSCYFNALDLNFIKVVSFIMLLQIEHSVSILDILCYAILQLLDFFFP